MSRVRRTFVLALPVAMLLMWLAAQASAALVVRGVDAGGYPTIRLSLVTDTPSSLVPQVRENGVVVSGLQASNLAGSKSVVLAVDRSQSMAGQSLRNAAAAADSFVAGKPSSDSIAVVAFGSQSLPLTAFSTSTIDADSALRSIAVDAHPGTALWDAVVMSASQLGSQPDRGRVIIVLTDGKDVSSRATLATAIAAARSVGAAVYPIAIAGPEYTPAPLRELAVKTGGKFFRAAGSATLAQVYSTIAAELARTWRISYLTPARPGERLQLRVSVPGQGAAAWAVQVPNGPGGASATSGPSRLLPLSLYGSGGTVAVAFGVGGCILLGFLFLLAARKESWVRKRLQPHITPTLRGNKVRRERYAAVTAVLRGTERALGNLRQWRSLKRLLERADLPLRAAEFAYIAVACGIMLGVVAGTVAQSGVGLAIGFLVGITVPFGFASYKARKRLKAFERQLPDLLITLAASLKAGHSFRSGIQTLVGENQQPAAGEFKRVLTDTQLGRPMEDSLSEMAERVGSKNFSFVITAVSIQRQVGGSLAGLFDMVAETVRQRQQFALRIKALTAMGRMSAYVLIALPILLALVMTFVNHSYMAPLWQTSTGHMMIVVGFVMMALGSLILKKIVSFKG